MAAKKKATARKAAPKKAPAKKKAVAKRRAAPKKAAPKKAAPKKAAPKKAAPKKAAAKPAARKAAGAVKARWSKTQILNEISAASELTRKQVSDVLDHLSAGIERHIKKGGAGEFVMPGLFKITTRKKPAVKARKGKDPFTGEIRMFKAKPASVQVKVRALKKLKDMAG